MRELATAIVLAAAIIAGAIFLSRPEPPRYATVTGHPFRLDTKTGEIVGCNRQTNECVIIIPAGDQPMNVLQPL